MIVEEQGRVIVNSCTTVYKKKSVVLLEIDLRTKNSELYSEMRVQGINYLFYAETDNSVFLDDNKPEGTVTVIGLPDYAGWSIFSLTHVRCTTRITLVKDKKR